jgi:hypothetical protein
MVGCPPPSEVDGLVVDFTPPKWGDVIEEVMHLHELDIVTLL